MKSFVFAVTVAAGILNLTGGVAARDHMWIVGSSTVQPFTKAVAERAAKAAGAPAPAVETTGTTPGIWSFCSGIGASYPDASNATRRMKKSEFETCQNNGVTEIVEIPIGLDILVVAQSRAGPAMRLTLAQIFLALAREVPDNDGRFVANPHRAWSDIDGTLPDLKIDVRVLPPISGTRDALQELFLQKGADSIPALSGLMKKDSTLQTLAKTVRSDGNFVTVREDQVVIAHELMTNPNALGVFGYRFLQASRATLRAVTIEGVEPTEEHAYDGKYKGTRKLYLYLKKANFDAVPGLNNLAAEYVSGAALGPDGYLLGLGFVPLSMADMIKTITLIGAMTPLHRDALPD
jgi:phosphate transport system substrate-binding protein